MCSTRQPPIRPAGRVIRDELLVPFLTDGVSAGDRCLAVVDTSEPEELLDALGTGGGAAQLTVLASRDVYLTDRGFDMGGMLDFYGAELRGVAEGRSGYDRIRTAGEMTWALRDIPGWRTCSPYIQPEEFLRQRDN